MPADPGSSRRAIGQLVGQAVMGAAVGLAVLGGLLATDAMSLLTLLRSVDGGELALLVLAIQFGTGFTTFAVVTALALGPAPASRQRWTSHLQWSRSAAVWRRLGRGL